MLFNEAGDIVYSFSGRAGVCDLHEVELLAIREALQIYEVTFPRTCNCREQHECYKTDQKIE